MGNIVVDNAIFQLLISWLIGTDILLLCTGSLSKSLALGNLVNAKHHSVVKAVGTALVI